MYEFFNGQFPVKSPNGTVYNTREDYAAVHPEINAEKVAVEMAGDTIMAISNFAILRANFNVNAGMTDAEALEYINEEINRPPVPPMPENTPATQADVLDIKEGMADLFATILEAQI